MYAKLSVFWVAFTFSPLCALAVRGANLPLPESVDIRVLVKREPSDLRVLVRVPLSVIRDTQFPVKDDVGHLDLNAIQMILPGAARYSIQDCFKVYENAEWVDGTEIVQARISQFSDQSFRSFDSAMSHLDQTPLDKSVNVLLGQAWLDIDFKYAIEGRGPLAISPEPANLGAHVSTQMQYIALDRSIHEFAFDGNPGWIFIEPRTADIEKQFIAHGASFIVRNAGIVLFIFCLVLPFRRFRDIRFIALIFVAGLSVGLIAPAFEFFPKNVWLRPLIETMSAGAILVVALIDIGGIYPLTRAALTAIVGFLYGISSSADLAVKSQFSGGHQQIASLAYWFGLVLTAELEMGLLIPILASLFKENTRRLEMIIVSGLAADAALGWFEEGWLQLREIPWHFPALDAGFFALLFEILAAVVLTAGLFWFFRGWSASRRQLKPSGTVGREDIAS